MIGAGLLIINGDDWGASEPTTDGILSCVGVGAVTSVSGMVFMADSVRAAEVARTADLAVGLHLNLTHPFDGPRLDPAVRDRQARIVAKLASGDGPRLDRLPSWVAELGSCIADQLGEFRRLYGRPPSHLDGHEHVHHSPAIVLSPALEAGLKIRPPFTFTPSEKPLVNRMLRSVAKRAERVRFRTPSYFFSLRDMHPRLGGRDLEEKLALSSGSSVEVMTHPSWQDEHEILLDPEWLRLIRQRPLGSYDDL